MKTRRPRRPLLLASLFALSLALQAAPVLVISGCLSPETRASVQLAERERDTLRQKLEELLKNPLGSPAAEAALADVRGRLAVADARLKEQEQAALQERIARAAGYVQTGAELAMPLVVAFAPFLIPVLGAVAAAAAGIRAKSLKVKES